MFSRLTRLMSVGLGCLALSACTSVTPAGLLAASRLDPLNTPPDRIAIAVGVPETFRLSSGDAVMRIAFREDTATIPTLVEYEVPLQFIPDEVGTVAANAPTETVYVASLLPEDAARFAKAQSDIRLARERGVEGAGTLTIEVVGGCHVGALPETLPVSTWLRTDPAKAFVPLTRRVDALGTMNGAVRSAFLRRLSPC